DANDVRRRTAAADSEADADAEFTRRWWRVRRVRKNEFAHAPAYFAEQPERAANGRVHAGAVAPALTNEAILRAVRRSRAHASEDIRCERDEAAVSVALEIRDGI